MAVKGIPGIHGRFFHRAVVNCSVETAWDIFTDHEGLNEFTGMTLKLTKEGYFERNGLGSIRVMGEPEDEFYYVEEITNYWVPYRVFGYHIINGKEYQPSHHQGLVRFTPLGETRCEWTYSMRCILPPKALEKCPDRYTEMLQGFALYMADYESECERRGHDIAIPAFPPPVDDEAIERGL